MFNWIKEVFAGLNTKHTHCRCCGVAIEDGGYGVVFLGFGFCSGCATELMRANAELRGRPLADGPA